MYHEIGATGGKYFIAPSINDIIVINLEIISYNANIANELQTRQLNF